jgi:hypothetical protein
MIYFRMCRKIWQRTQTTHASFAYALLQTDSLLQEGVRLKREVCVARFPDGQWYLAFCAYLDGARYVCQQVDCG